MGLDHTFMFNVPVEPPGLFDVPVDPGAWELYDRAERLELRLRVDAAIERLREVEAELEDIAIELSAGDHRDWFEPQSG